jgi:hypothetical protein
MHALSACTRFLVCLYGCNASKADIYVFMHHVCIHCVYVSMQAYAQEHSFKAHISTYMTACSWHNMQSHRHTHIIHRAKHNISSCSNSYRKRTTIPSSIFLTTLLSCRHVPHLADSGPPGFPVEGCRLALEGIPGTAA